MPTYTYRCSKCGKEHEAVQSMTDPPLKRCPSCKGALRRTFHPVGIVLKGSGFHKTDYAASKPDKGRSEEKKSSSKESSTEKKDSASGAGSGDAKKSD